MKITSVQNLTQKMAQMLQKETGKEPVKIGCPFCSTIMGAPSNMKQHILIHTGEKPFSCAFCELKTIQKSTLEKHMRRKHSQK